MTLRECYLWGKQELQDTGVIDFEQDAWLLLEHVTGYNRSYYFCHDTEDVSKEKESKYRNFIEESKSRIPLQQLTGTQEFMGIEFFVNEHVLIPRQDTEILIEEAEKRILGEMQILDMCTGSGCILLSLLKRNKSLKGVGADISTKALEVAATNAKRLGIETTLKESDLFQKIEGTFDLILSNPPYIKSKEIEELADLIEGIYAVAIARGCSLEELETIRAQKAEKRGGFAKKILLKEVKGYYNLKYQNQRY